MNLIFLDIDGVLNCQIFYHENYKEAKKKLKKAVKKAEIERMEYYTSQICKERIQWLNSLCKDTNSKVVISSSWRHGKTVIELRDIFEECGSEFDILDKTPEFVMRGKEGELTINVVRGEEIRYWLENTKIKYDNYAIIDDDSDFLLWQREHFFQTDGYSGLTPNTCYKIQRFLNKI
jgi:hypothetical protein